MADITIDAALVNANARSNRSIVFTSALIGYSFMMNGSVFGYYKTVDGGATWTGPTTVKSVTTGLAFDVWYDQWTPGDKGRCIHMWYVDSTNDDIFYNRLDTSSGTLSGEVTIFNGATAVAGFGLHVSGAKMRGGNLLCAFDMDAGAETGTYRSVDNGATWGVRTNLIEAATDRCLIFPGNEADPQDAWILYQDADADELTLKVHDDSADTNSESAAINGALGMIENSTDITGQGGFSGSIRQSDGHLICAFFTEFDSATGDFKVYDINGTGSITALTNIATNIDDMYYVSVFIHQRTNNIYVSYIGKSDGSETLGTSTNVYYAKSTDGGVTWSVDNAYSQGAAALWRNTWTPLSGDRFHINWREDVASDDLETNFINNLDLSGTSFNNYLFIDVGNGMSTTEKIR